MDVKKAIYIIVKCTELVDQYECEYDRELLKVVSDYAPYNKKGYEIYEISTNGTLNCIHKASTVTEKGIGMFWFKQEPSEQNQNPDKIIWKKKDTALQYSSIDDAKEWLAEIGETRMDDDEIEAMLDFGEGFYTEKDDGYLMLTNYEDDDLFI